MKIFSWMQSKLHARKETGKLNPITSTDEFLGETREEELSDWPRGLLAIGTFGNKSVKEMPESCNLQENKLSQYHLKYITPKEIENVQKEANVILNKQVSESNSAAEETHNLFRRSSSIILSREKESRSDSTINSIGKNSLSFLVKKIFKTKTTPTLRLRDPLPEARLERSRMEKVLRATLNKKVFPQAIIPKATTTRKYLNDKQPCMTGDNDKLPDDVAAGSKWVKTDSDFIVLEI